MVTRDEERGEVKDMEDLSIDELAELRERAEKDAGTGRSALVVDGPKILRMIEEIERRRIAELLDSPESAEEKLALDSISKSPEEILRQARARATGKK